MNHEINLTGYTATCGEPNNMLDLGTAGSYGLEKLHVTADAAWDGLTITATFTNSGSTTVPVTDGTVDVPPEATRLPTRDRVRYGMLAFKGVDANGKLRIISTPIYYKVQASAATDGSNTIDPTPDQYAQFVAEVMAEADRAEAAADRAESAGGNVTPEQIAEAVNNYLNENPVQATPIDDTLTQSGQAADAKAVGDRFNEICEEKVNLPKDTDGNVIPGTVGWYAVSDGAGGITWVESAPSTGGGDAETTTHGIIWDLVNVTSSNNAVSVSDGASLVAVLNPADGYVLGDVTITMGGEVLTECWNADTATVIIASVTGDVIISCAGMVGVPDVPIEVTFAWGNPSWSNGGFTVGVSYSYIGNAELIDATENNIKFICPESAEYSVSGTVKCVVALFDSNDSFVGYYDIATGEIGNDSWQIITCGDEVVISSGYKIRILSNTGTPDYWTNVVEFYETEDQFVIAEEAVLSFDNDVAQNYAVSTASILGEETATDTKTAYGISCSLAAVIDEVRSAWMIEYGGDYRKIPIIVSTDQHGRRNSGIFNMLGKTLNMHDVSKVMNLGDTVAVEWNDADAEHPLLSCAALENWCESIKEIPFSKRLDVYGNHDAWYYDGYSVEGNAIGTRYPSTMQHLDQYFRNIYARRNNNHGWGAIYDDYFNVKYVVVTGFEYKDGASTSRISTAQMTWLISELEKNDGYDVVIVSHVPLRVDPSQMILPTADTYEDVVYHLSSIDTDAMFAARKAGGTGTITDSDGVEHTYDFSGCDNPVLCSLHGHTHEDAYLYLNNELLVNAFDWFDGNTIFFVLIDRVNRLLNIWKIEGDALTYQNYQIPLDKPAE